MTINGQTSNFGFTKPDVNEFYDVNVQNENWDKLDDVLNGMSAKITCGTEELIEGESELPTGTLYFVYE